MGPKTLFYQLRPLYKTQSKLETTNPNIGQGPIKPLPEVESITQGSTSWGLGTGNNAVAR